MAAKRERKVSDMPRMARLIEVAISVLASIATSAVVVSWKISATLTKFESDIASHSIALTEQAARTAQTSASIAGIETVNSQQSAAIAVADARFDDILRRLASMDDKLDRLSERR